MPITTMMKTTVTLASLVAFALLMQSGCTAASASSAQKPGPITVLALDTSESAKAKHEELYNRMVHDMESMRPEGRMVLFRFDSSPAEFYDGKPVLDGAEAGRLVKPELNRESRTEGTNLAKLLSQIDKLIGRGSEPLDVRVYTDCGTEKMTKIDDQAVAEQLGTWSAERELKVSFHGVVSGFRERIRELVPNAKVD